MAFPASALSTANALSTASALSVASALDAGTYGTVFYDDKQNTVTKWQDCNRYIHASIREGVILSNLSHERIVKIKETAYDSKENKIGFVMPAYNNYLHCRSEIKNDIKLLQTIYDLFDALAYLHTRRIIHRDVKEENLLLDNDFRIILCDFGLARIINGSSMGPAFSGKTTTFSHRAPEAWTNFYDYAIDIWSAGIVMVDLLTGYSLRRLILANRLCDDTEEGWKKFSCNEGFRRITLDLVMSNCQKCFSSKILELMRNILHGIFQPREKRSTALGITNYLLKLYGKHISINSFEPNIGEIEYWSDLWKTTIDFHTTQILLRGTKGIEPSWFKEILLYLHQNRFYKHRINFLKIQM